MSEQIPLLSVSQVNSMADEVLSKLTVRVVGELDERFNTSRGYGIGRLSDEDASIDIFVPGYIVRKDGDVLKAGKKIVAEGKLGVYVPYGKFSLTVSAVEPYGEGVLQRELLRLKKALTQKGYFAEERKRALPDYPRRIGIITAKESAAWRDFRKHVVKEYAGLELILHDALMQGSRSKESVIAAFAGIERENPDTIVLTRGGGSLQDLMSFNSEEVVKAIVDAKAPVISAIGHEIDRTLADLAADVAVSTPTKAAEVIASKYAGLRKDLSDQKSRLARVKLYYQKLPLELARERERLRQGIERVLAEGKEQLNGLNTRLRLLNPQKILSRGYSITYTKDGRIVRSAKNLKIEGVVRTRLYKGSFISKITEVEGEVKKEK